MRYKVTGIDRYGNDQTMHIDAGSEKEAAKYAREQQIKPFDISLNVSGELLRGTNNARNAVISIVSRAFALMREATDRGAALERSPPVERISDNPPLGKVEQASERQFERLESSDIAKPVEWSLELIRSLDWKRFEEVCAWYFQAKGRHAKVTEFGGDGGIDVLLLENGDPGKVLGVVQCKAWTKKPVGVREVRELLGVMTDVGCPLGVYVTTSYYTPDAKTFADGKPIELIDAALLLASIQELSLELRTDLLRKTTSGDYTTPSCPNCGIKLILRTSRKGNNAGSSFWGCLNFPRCRYRMQCAKSA